MRAQPAAKALAISLALAGPAYLTPILVTPAYAATATQSEANRIETALAGYFDNVPGVISVTPDGDHYKMRVDPAPLAAKLSPGTVIKISPITYTLTDKGNGLWGTTLTDQPLDVTIDVKDVTAQKITIGSLSSTGVFDTNIGGFRNTSTQAKGIAYDATTFKNGKIESKVNYAIDSLQSQSTGKAATEGVDVTHDVQVKGLAETIEVPRGPAQGDNAPRMMTMNLIADSASQKVQMAGLRLPKLLALYRWVLAHNSKADIDAHSKELAGMIRAALPVFDTTTGSGSIEKVSVTTPLGIFAADKATFGLDLTGAVPDGKLRENVVFEGLRMPPGLLPSWAAPLMPEKLALDLSVSKFDLAATAKVLVDALETGDDLKGPEADAKLLKAILPTGRFQIATDGTAITGPDYTVSMTGAAQISPQKEAPDMSFTITATGFDNVLKAVDGFPAPMKQRAVPMLMLARGFAKTGPGADLTWVISTSPEGHLLINGQDMGPMKK